jgi:redox-sensitive bicupin YhaK (pirin superfamily)
MSVSARRPSVLPIDPSRLALRRAADRGHFDHGWLDTFHTFSFGDYYDPENMGFRRLRVINEDVVAPATGFPTHPHREMEILTYVLEGALAHRDSSGGGGVIRPGEVQHMTAGTGIRHSEANPSPTEPVKLLQVWIEPTNYGRPPSYEQKAFPVVDRTNRLRLVASPDARDGSLGLETDANVYASVLEPGAKVAHENGPERHVWVQVARGSIAVNGLEMDAGDGVATSEPGSLELVAGPSGAEILLFDLA